MEPAHFGEREATTDRVVSVAGSLRAEMAPGASRLLDGPSRTSMPGPWAPDIDAGIDAAIALGRALVDNLSRVLLGTPGALTAAAMAALSGGHLLIEDVPGVGKTVLARALAVSLGAELSRGAGPSRPAALRRHRGVGVRARHRHVGVPARARCSPTSCSSTSSTAPRRAPRPPCSRRWRSSR